MDPCTVRGGGEARKGTQHLLQQHLIQQITRIVTRTLAPIWTQLRLIFKKNPWIFPLECPL